MSYIVRSSDGREWGNYATKREASDKAKRLRRDRGGFRGSFRVIRKAANRKRKANAKRRVSNGPTLPAGKMIPVRGVKVNRTGRVTEVIVEKQHMGKLKRNGKGRARVARRNPYRIEPLRFTRRGRTVHPEGYYYADYLNYHGKEFGTAKEAREFIRKNYQGKDSDGIGVVFKVVKV